MYRLEANKLVFVKSRNVSRATYIVPRVNLPFLYFYPRLHDEIFNPRLHDEIKYEAVPETRTINDAGYGSSLPYVRLKKPALLNQHIDVLLYNIGTALARPIKQLSRTFEDMVPFVELLTVAARHTTMSHISLEALIPDVVFKPWTNETLSVSPTVLRQPFHSTCVAAEEVAKKAAEAVATEAGATSSVGAAARRPDPPCASSPQVAVEVAVRYATSRDCDAVYVLQGTVKTQCIEYVSTLFSVRDKPVLSLCSMKLRETADTVEVANRVHQLVRQTEGTSLEKGSYYVMLYCCAAKKSIEIENLPAGTIVVPYEAWVRLLYPFGLNPLSTVE